MATRTKEGPFYDGNKIYYKFSYYDTMFATITDLKTGDIYIATVSNVNPIVEDTVPFSDIDRLRTFITPYSGNTRTTKLCGVYYSNGKKTGYIGDFEYTLPYPYMYWNEGMYEEDGVRYATSWNSNSSSQPQSLIDWDLCDWGQIWKQDNENRVYTYYGTINYLSYFARETYYYPGTFQEVRRYHIDFIPNSAIPFAVSSDTDAGEMDDVENDVVEYLFNWDLNPSWEGEQPMPWNKPDSWAGLGFINVYNPSRSDIINISNFVFNLKGYHPIALLNVSSSEILSNIIAFKMYPFNGKMATLQGAQKNFKIRNYNSSQIIGHYQPFTVRELSEQYLEIDMGTIGAARYFNDERDFSPYTNVSIFIPFVGFINLSANDVINHMVNLTYRVDVATGGGIAIISIKNSAGDVIYKQTQTCNLSIDIPFNGVTYDGVIKGFLGGISAAVGIGATIATGGAALPAVMGAGSALMGVAGALSPDFVQSGGLSGNVGMLGDLRPYMIITRPISEDIGDYPAYYGAPSNNSDLLSSFSGYIQVREVHLDSVECTQAEKQEIENLLKTGVII